MIGQQQHQLDKKWGNVTPIQHPEHQFIKELQLLLTHEPGQQIHVDHDTPFHIVYEQLQPIFKQLQEKHHLEENPPGTNTEVVLFQSRIQSKWYNENIFNKEKPDPMELLSNGLESLFFDNNTYTYPDGRIVYYKKGTSAIPRIKRDIFQEFNIMNKRPLLFKVKHVLSQIESRFTWPTLPLPFSLIFLVVLLHRDITW